MTGSVRRAFDDVDAAFRPLVDEDVAPGVAWGVVDRTGLVHAAGHGVVRDQGPCPDATTAFRIASMTKSFTAASIMILVERGALRLADPVSRYVPEFAAVRLPTDDSPQLTIEMLMSMSSGLPTDDAWADRQESMSREEFGRLLSSGVRFARAPDSRYEYTNLAFAVLGCVVAAASGQSYHEFVDQELARLPRVEVDDVQAVRVRGAADEHGRRRQLRRRGHPLVHGLHVHDDEPVADRPATEPGDLRRPLPHRVEDHLVVAAPRLLDDGLDVGRGLRGVVLHP